MGSKGQQLGLGKVCVGNVPSPVLPLPRSEQFEEKTF